MKNHKILLSAIFIIILFAPDGVYGIDYKQSAKDVAVLYSPRCWLKEVCEKVFNGRFESDTNCNPAPGIKSQISAGGSIEFGECFSNAILPDRPYFLSVPIPGFEAGVKSIPALISKLYIFAVAVAIIFAIIKIIHSGVQWSTSQGNVETIANAKEGIANAIIGLLLLLGTYVILLTINPDILVLKPPSLVTRRLPDTISEHAARFFQDSNAPTEICPKELVNELLKLGSDISCGTIVPILDSGVFQKTCMASTCSKDSVCFIQQNPDLTLMTNYKKRVGGYTRDIVTECKKGPYFVKVPVGLIRGFFGAEVNQPVDVDEDIQCGEFDSEVVGNNKVGSKCPDAADNTQCSAIIKYPSSFVYKKDDPVLCVGGQCGPGVPNTEVRGMGFGAFNKLACE